MKIGIVCPYDMFRGGGVQEHVLAQAAELRRRGHDVRIITPRPRTFKETDAPAGILFVGSSANVKTPISTNLEVGMAFSRNAVDDMLESEEFDLLHVHEPEVPIIGAQIIAKADCPVITTFHSMYPDTAVAKTLETMRGPLARSLLAKSAAITAVSEVAARFIREQTASTVNIIPNGIDLKKYRTVEADVSKDSGSPVILYVGRLEKRKGLKYLLRAFEELSKSRPESRLIIVGEGPERAKLEQYTQSHKLPHVVFTGYVEEPRKLELLNEASVFCSPALYGESFGIVLLEAMAKGIPVVAGDNPGYKGVMQGRGALSIINPKETSEFARRLELLLYDASVRKLWKDWAAQYVERFDYSNVVNSYLKIYKQVVKADGNERA